MPFLESTHIYKIIVPAGEKMKSFEHYQQTLEHLLEYNLTRNTCLVAIGGGATGDFTGFLASSLLEVLISYKYLQQYLPMTLAWEESRD